MKQNKLGFRYLCQLALKYLPLILLLMLLVAVDSATYSYVSMFIKYIIAVLDGETVSTTLPKFIINIFDSGNTVILRVIYASVGLAVYQIIRGLMKFITGCYRQILGETISKNIRKEMYEHIQNLSYSYHIRLSYGLNF